MKKIIFKYWMINLLLCILLYVAYRTTIVDRADAGNGLLGVIQNILDILLNLGFSLLYLTAMLVCSFTVFLNLVRKIREHYLFSWLAFAGAPLLLIVILVITLLTDAYHYPGSVITKLLIFSILYVGLETILFLQFRKRYFTAA